MNRRPAGSASQDDQDEGFTLVELLLSTIITLIITTTIGTSLIVGLKTSDATAVRLNESHDAQLLSTYLINDLQSIDEGGFAVSPSGPSSCASAGNESLFTARTILLRLSWTQPAPVAQTFVAEYSRARFVADQSLQLVRNACVGGVETTSQVMVHQLSQTTSPVVKTNQPPTVAMTVTEPSGYTYTVSGVRRTPDSSPLPVVPWECTIFSAVGLPDPAYRATAAPGPLTQDLKIEVQSGGACSSLSLRLDPGGSAIRPVTLTESPSGSGLWKATIPKAEDTWTDGDKAFEIREGATVRATLRLLIRQTCLVSTVSANPTTASRVAGPAPGNLASDVQLTASTTGTCIALEAEYTPATGTAVLVPMVENPIGTWGAVVQGVTDLWTDGSHPFTFHEPAAPVLGTAPFTVTPSCLLKPDTLQVAPNPVTVGNGQLQNTLTSNVTINLNVTGDCSGLKVSFTPDASPPPDTVFLVQDTVDPSKWSGTLGASAYAWTKGSKPLAVLDGSDNPIASIDLVVQ